jgi:hypothetical protein
VIEHFFVGLALLLGLGGGFLLTRGRRRDAGETEAVHQILLPFTGAEISRRAVDAALRLARAEGATLMPAYLAQVPKSLPLDCAIPKEADRAMAMLEAIEQRASAEDVPVDAPHRTRPLLPPRPGPPPPTRDLRPRRHLSDRGRSRGLLQRRPGLAPGESPRRGPDPAPGPADHRVLSANGRGIVGTT